MNLTEDVSEKYNVVLPSKFILCLDVKKTILAEQIATLKVVYMSIGKKITSSPDIDLEWPHWLV